MTALTLILFLLPRRVYGERALLYQVLKAALEVVCQRLLIIRLRRSPK